MVQISGGFAKTANGLKNSWQAKAVPTLESLTALATVFEVSLVDLFSVVRESKEPSQVDEQGHEQGSLHSRESSQNVESEILLLLESLRGCALAQLTAVRKIVDFLLAAFTSR